MFESKSGVFLIAGLFFFGLAFVVMGYLPIAIYQGEPEKTLDDLAREGILPEFVQLREQFPDRFQKAYGEVSYASFAAALKRGHRIYVGEGCWHCHSQFIRPVSNEDLRWGPVSHAREYQNVLQRPVLFGTRRVGPDLIREGSRKSNDWHLAHFFKPTSVVPSSVMPEYSWFYDPQGYPNADGMAIITYVQWLGSWLSEYPYWRGEGPAGPTTGGQADPAAGQEVASAALADPLPAGEPS
ncbi:MAG: cbb3-type cytochrome c oxidase subunit II [Phycisphaerae bacterium]